EWLCGERPFHGAFTELASQHMFIPPPSLRGKIPTISLATEQVVMRALAKDPQQRFPNVQAFAHTLEQASQSAQSQPTVYAPPPLQSFQPTSLATPPNSPRQQTAIPTPGQWSHPTVLPSNRSSQHGILTPPSTQPIQQTVAAVPSNSSSQPPTV